MYSLMSLARFVSLALLWEAGKLIKMITAIPAKIAKIISTSINVKPKVTGKYFFINFSMDLTQSLTDNL